jgi:hypothetical protein
MSTTSIDLAQIAVPNPADEPFWCSFISSLQPPTGSFGHNRRSRTNGRLFITLLDHRGRMNFVEHSKSIKAARKTASYICPSWPATLEDRLVRDKVGA